MPQDTRGFEFVFDGGWSTDLGLTLGRFNWSSLVKEGLVTFPWLIDAEDLYYELDGGLHKCWGAIKLNSSAISGDTITNGLFEYYRIGTSGTTVRKRLAHSGTVIYKEDLDGTWDSLKTGLVLGAIPDYTVFNDIVVIASDTGTDVPFSWDQTTFQNLAGSPPNFAFSVRHRNRLWYAGVNANPSRLFFSGNGDPTDHSGSGAGAIDIDAWDGDKITGIRSHKGDLWVWKGPNTGSIHRITGSAPTGQDFFKHVNYTNEVGAANNRVIVPFGSDLAFMNIDGTWHKLSEAEGTQVFRNSSLSAPINTFIADSVDNTKFSQSIAVNWIEKSLVLCALATNTSTTSSPNTVVNDTIIGFDYRFDPVRWFKWKILEDQGGASLAIFEDAAGKRMLVVGQYDGFVLFGGQKTRLWNGNAINYNFRTPYTNLGDASVTKTISELRVGRINRGSGDIEITYFLDTTTVQRNFRQSSGTLLDSFTLDTDLLGQAEYDTVVTSDVAGEFRDISLRARHQVPSDDVDIRTLGLSVENIVSNAES